MKHLLHRILTAVLIALFTLAVFNAWPDAPVNLSPSNKLAYYLGAYAVPIAFWIVIIEGAHVVRSLIRRKKHAEPNQQTESK